MNFKLTHPLWEKRYQIEFKFDGRCYYGLFNPLHEYRLSDEKIKCFHKQLEALGTHNCKKMNGGLSTHILKI